MSTKLKIIDDSPVMAPEDDEFRFEGVTTDELSQNALGGTEMMKYGLYDRLDESVRDEVQIICSRVRDVDPNRPTVLWLHDMFNDPEANHLADEEQRKRFNKLVFVSNFQKTQYELAYGIKPSESVVLKNCIEPIELIDKPTDEIRLIYHTTPHRGLDILVPVFEELCNHHDNIVLDVYSSFEIYGWGQRDADYEHLFERCKQHPKINYHGYQPNEVVREALQKAHIFAFPSIWPETSCIAAMEAMSAGCVIVCPDYAALPETTAGFAVSYAMHEHPNTHANIFVQVLSATIDKLQHPEMQNRIRFQKAYADAFYSWETRIAQWNGLLGGLVKQT
jgi:UDP-glucose:(glucosyl)LPS alpha-1,2-glucosyltransferase